MGEGNNGGVRFLRGLRMSRLGAQKQPPHSLPQPGAGNEEVVFWIGGEVGRLTLLVPMFTCSC